MISYRLLYDVASAEFDGWFFIGIGSLLTAVGAALVFAPDLTQRLMPAGLQGGAWRVFSWFYFVFALGWTLLTSWIVATDFLELRTASRTNSCSVVVGSVLHFHPKLSSARGSDPESFEVNHVRFAYSDHEISGGFNQTASQGGPVYSGMLTRICYVSTRGSNVIVRLEEGQLQPDASNAE